MTDLLEPDDLTPFATIEDDKAQSMIIDATAMAVLHAPCLGTPDDLTPKQFAAAKAVLRAAVLRWNEMGTGAMQQQTMGPFGVTVDTRQPRRTLFSPDELNALQRICEGDTDTGAFSVDTAAAPMRIHQTFGGWTSQGSPWGWSDDGSWSPTGMW